MNIKNTDVKTISAHLSRYTQMIARCYDEDCKAYKSYGAKGITVCQEWLDSPDAFIKWCTTNGWAYGLVLDKDILCDALGINPKVYSPSTCKFITKEENIAYMVENTTRQAVACYDSKGAFVKAYRLIKDAEKEHGPNIGRSCAGKRLTVNKLFWRYIDDQFNPPSNIIVPGTKIRGKPIIEIDFNGNVIATYVNAPEASRITGLTATSINQVANGTRTSVYGRFFTRGK